MNLHRIVRQVVKLVGFVGVPDEFLAARSNRLGADIERASVDVRKAFAQPLEARTEAFGDGEARTGRRASLAQQHPALHGAGFRHNLQELEQGRQNIACLRHFLEREPLWNVARTAQHQRHAQQRIG